MNSIPFLWTNDDIGPGVADHLRRHTEFLRRFGLKGTFFVIPQLPSGETIDADANLLRAIDEARAEGHEFLQHGFVHTPFESGVPATWMLDFAPEVRREFDENRLEIEQTHTLERLMKMLTKGHDIWRKAFQCDSPGYRAGWGAYCRNLFLALDALGYSFSSSITVERTSWEWNRGNWEFPVEKLPDRMPKRPFRITGQLLEIPITGGDYAFSVPSDPEKIQRMVALAEREFEYCLNNGIPFVMLSHFHGLAYDGGTGYVIHEKILTKLLSTGRAEALTMSELHARVIQSLDQTADKPEHTLRF